MNADSPSNGDEKVQILRDVEKFLKNSNMPAARFGREAVKDPRFVFDLLLRLQACFAHYWLVLVSTGIGFYLAISGLLIGNLLHS